MTRKRTALDQAQANLDARIGEVAAWRGKHAGALDEIAELDGAAVEGLLADPEAADTVAIRIATARERARLAQRAIGAAQEQELQARRAVVAVIAAQLDPEIEAARNELAAHEAKVAQLVAELEEFAGGQWRPLSAAQARDEQLGHDVHGHEVPGQYVWHRPKAHVLRAEVARLEHRAEVLTFAAEGGDVHARWPHLDAYTLPPELRPGSGVLPTPGVVDPLAHLRARIEQAETARVDAERLARQAGGHVETARQALDAARERDAAEDQAERARGREVKAGTSHQHEPAIRFEAALRALSEATARLEGIDASLESWRVDLADRVARLASP